MRSVSNPNLIAVGVLAALLWRDRARLRWITDPRGAQTLFWAGAGVIGWLWLRSPLLDVIDPFDRTLLQLVLALGFGAMLLGAVAGGGPQRLMGAKTLNPVAKLSYCLYLAHMDLIPAAIKASKTAFAGISIDSATGFVSFVPFYVILSVFGAFMLHFGAEKPFLECRNYREKTHRSGAKRRASSAASSVSG